MTATSVPKGAKRRCESQGQERHQGEPAKMNTELILKHNNPIGHTLVRFAGYSFLTSMPVLSFMLLISSRFENMWVPLGIGVAGFLSGMALANSGLALLLVHPFVIILKPAVAMSAQPDSTVALVALVETLLFLAVGLWLAKYRRYE